MKKLTRRDFLKVSMTGVGALAMEQVLAACGQATPSPVPLAPTETNTPEAPAATPATPTATPDARPIVAIGKADRYDQTQLRAELERMLQSLGGLADVIRPGAKVGIKVNMTGAYYQDGVTSPPATEWFAVNPALVGALCELLIDAGAGQISVVEGLGAAKPAVFDLWGYTDMATRVGADLVDLSYPDPYSDFADAPVGPGWFIHETYKLHPILTELDAFISIGKMKSHSFAGVTLSMKNLMGITPLSVYKKYPGDTWRQSLHGDRQMDTRMPRVLLDLNRARPIHLALVDGIWTSEGGADPWEPDASQVKPGILLAGKSQLATDAVGATVMGFNPVAPSGSVPFLHSENYLALAQEIGMGTIKLDEINLTGYQVQDVLYQFKPAP